MNIELKNVKHSKFASQETECFQADVYICGVKSGEVRNEGTGGANWYYPQGLEVRLNAIAATLPMIDLHEGLTHVTGTKMVPQDADLMIGALLADALNKKELKRQCRGKTLFRKPGETYQDGEYNTIAVKYCPAVKTHLTQKYGADVLILNETI